MRGAALTAKEVERIAAGPRIRRVTHGAERLLRRERLPAMIAGDGKAGGGDILFATHFAAARAAPANGHR